VLAETEYFAAIAAKSLKNTVAIQEAMIVNADLCLFLRHEFAIDVNLA
jgi:hypothetical protein